MSTIRQSLNRIALALLPDDIVEADPLERRRSQLLIKTVLMLLFWGGFFSVLYYIFFQSAFGFAVCLIGTLATSGALAVIRYTGRLTLAGNFIVVCLYAAMVGLAVSNGGLAPPIGWLALLPILALLFAGTTSAYVWLGLISVTYTGAYAATLWPSVQFPRVLSVGQIEVFRYLEVLTLGIDFLVIVQLKDGLQEWLMGNLRERERRTQRILKTAPDGIIVAAGDGRVTRANPAARQIFGFDGEMVDVSMEELLPDLELSTVEDSEETAGLEVTGHKVDGETFPAHVEYTTLASNGVSEIILAVRDITEQKRREADLREARDHAREASRAKSVFLANMSHELRTPLNAIINYSEMLINDAENTELEGDERLDNERLSEDLDRIRRSGNQLLSLVDGVLDLSKIATGRVDTYVESVELATLFDELRATLTSRADEHDNALQMELGEEVGTMETDREKLRQILLNLGDNACKFTEEGVVRLEARRGDDEEMIFEVTDNGIGMEEDEIDGIFESFHQIDASSTRQYGGTGLGLAICRNFVEVLDGTISVDSTPGEGTTFTVRLPIEGPSEASDEPGEALEHLPSETTAV